MDRDSFSIMLGYLPLNDREPCVLVNRDWRKWSGEWHGWTREDIENIIIYKKTRLITCGAVNTRLDFALEMATVNNYFGVVRYLLAFPDVDPAVDDNWLLCHASRCGYHKIVKLLLKYPRVTPSCQDNYPIIAASYADYYLIVKVLLNDPRTNICNGTLDPVVIAAMSNNVASLRLLLNDSRVDPNKYKNSIMDYAIERNYYRIIKLLIANKRITGSYNLDVLVTAIKHRSCGALYKLIKYKCIDLLEYGDSALITATTQNNIHTVELLIKDARVNPIPFIPQIMKISKDRDRTIKLLHANPNVSEDLHAQYN